MDTNNLGVIILAVAKRILENQEAILLALSELITPKCTNSGTAQVNNQLIDNYHLTRKMLGEDYIER